MPVEIPKALIDAGGWVFGAAVLAAVITLLIRGDLALKREVTRETERADREAARADSATVALEKQAEVQEGIAIDIGKFGSQVGALVSILGQILRLRWPQMVSEAESEATKVQEAPR